MSCTIYTYLPRNDRSLHLNRIHIDYSLQRFVSTKFIFTPQTPLHFSNHRWWGSFPVNLFTFCRSTNRKWQWHRAKVQCLPALPEIFLRFDAKSNANELHLIVSAKVVLDTTCCSLGSGSSFKKLLQIFIRLFTFEPPRAAVYPRRMIRMRGMATLEESLSRQLALRSCLDCWK